MNGPEAEDRRLDNWNALELLDNDPHWPPPRREVELTLPFARAALARWFPGLELREPQGHPTVNAEF